MKTISEIMPVAVQNISAPVQQQSEQKQQTGNTFSTMPAEMRGRLINRLFSALKTSHPFQIRSILKDVPEWETVMKRDLIAHPDFQLMTAEQIKAGLDKAKAREFMPTNAHQFVELCRQTPQDLGLPSEMEAFSEAGSKSHDPMNQSWSHKIVCLAGRNLWHNLRSSCSQFEHDTVRKQYIANYRTLVARMVSGCDIAADVPMQIEDHRGTAIEAERAGNIALRNELIEKGIPEKMSRDDAMARMRAML